MIFSKYIQPIVEEAQSRGIDIITPNIQESYGHILELNLYPGFEMHWHPNEGTSSHPEKPFIDILFPETIS